jgi:hypothetical protein
MLSFEQRTSNVLFVVASTREKENWVIFCVMCQGHIRVPVPLGESMQQLQPAAFLRAFVPKDGILSLTDRNGRKHAAIAASSISTGVRTKGRNFVFNR